MHRTTLTALGVALVAASLCGAGRAGDGGTPEGGVLPPPPVKEKTLRETLSKVAEMLWKEPGKLAGRLKGRVLGSLIRKGMTLKQVEQLIGEDPLRLTFLEMPFPKGCIYRGHYSPVLGLWFSTTQQAGVFLVDERPATYDQLLD
jgi:hypothetical protein